VVSSPLQRLNGENISTQVKPSEFAVSLDSLTKSFYLLGGIAARECGPVENKYIKLISLNKHKKTMIHSLKVKNNPMKNIYC